MDQATENLENLQKLYRKWIPAKKNYRIGQKATENAYQKIHLGQLCTKLQKHYRNTTEICIPENHLDNSVEKQIITGKLQKMYTKNSHLGSNSVEQL